jgi:hypothetical protein
MNSQGFIERLEAVLTPWTGPPRNQNRTRPNGATVQVSPERMRAYAEAALEGERQTLARMPPKSGRNPRLFNAGCKLGKFVHHSVLSLDEVESALVHDACNANGLIAEDGFRACQRSLVSGIRKAEGDDLPILEEGSSPDNDPGGGWHTHGKEHTDGAKTSRENVIRENVIKAWPIMESKATHGIVGSIARLATENSEADPVAVIATVLVYAAAEFGRAQYTRIGDDIHHSRHFGAIVGQSSRARKGTSYGPVRRIFELAEKFRMSASTLPFPSGSKLKVSNGPLSSGEGLVYAVRDGSDGEDSDDHGVHDKRLLVIEQELGAALRAFQRTGNNLSMILRMAYDGGTLEPLTKNGRTVATDPHINVLGHITQQELISLLTATEVWNGLGNRFQWLMARRPKLVPFPKPMPEKDVEEIATELAHVITLAHQRGTYDKSGSHELVLSNSAQEHWANVYPELTRDHPGILGAVTSRQEAHARRLALTYAQLDGAERIEIIHLEAALAFCRYAFDSAVYLFGDTELDPIAQKIMEALAAGSKTQTELMGLFGRNMKAADLTAVLRHLQERGRITLAVDKTGGPGRPAQVWSINE